MTRLGLAVVLTACLSGLPAIEAAYADPPPWAPAHGWRAKGKDKNKPGKGRKQPVVQAKSYYQYAMPLGIDSGSCNRDVIGALLGGAAGGLIGSQVGKGDGKLVAVGAGVFLGAMLGGVIGRSMDGRDQNCVGHVLESAQTGQTVTWSNPDGGRYQVTPTKTFQAESGRYCREYTTTAVIDGKTERLYGTSCRQPDGSWQLSN